MNNINAINKQQLNQEYYILNENNKLITTSFIESQLKRYDITYKVKSLETFQMAMIHMSYLIRDENFYKNSKTKLYQIQTTDIEPIKDPKSAIPLQKKSYETLEFLGDAVIHLILGEYLYLRYTDEDEGFLTRLRTKLENGDELSKFSRSIGLGEYIIISRYVEKNGGRETNNKILEDSFEAFVGALFKEAGFDLCKKFITKLIETEVDMAQLLHQETNFKEKLLIFFHKRKWKDPVYGQLDVSGPENKKLYTMYVKCKKNDHDDGTIVGISTGCSSKRKGEQEAAKQALIDYGVYKENESDGDEREELDEDHVVSVVNGGDNEEYEEYIE